MYGVFACAAVAVGALVFTAPAAARPFTDVSALTPVNKQDQQLQQVRRGRPATLVVAFRMRNAPRADAYRVRVSYSLVRGDNQLRVMSKRAPIVFTGIYRFRLPINVPTRFDAGNYRLRGLVEVIEDGKVVAQDWRVRTLRVR